MKVDFLHIFFYPQNQIMNGIFFLLNVGLVGFFGASEGMRMVGDDDNDGDKA